MNKDLYNYKAKLVRAVDGDTVEVLIDLGFKFSFVERVRIAKIDAPEKKSSYILEKTAGKKVADYLTKLLSEKQLYLTTIKTKGDKYDRYLAEIIVDCGGGIFELSSHLMGLGFAHSYDGGKKQPWGKEELEKIINYNLET